MTLSRQPSLAEVMKLFITDLKLRLELIVSKSLAPNNRFSITLIVKFMYPMTQF